MTSWGEYASHTGTTVVKSKWLASGKQISFDEMVSSWTHMVIAKVIWNIIRSSDILVRPLKNLRS